MAEELNTNPTPPVADAPASPVPASSAGNVPLEMSPTIETIPAPAPAPEPAPVSPTPTPPPAPAPVTPPIDPKPAAPVPAPEPVSSVRSLLDKAKAKIQFRKQAKLEKIMVFAKAQGGITNDQAQKILRVSDATATRYLAQLVREGRLRRISAKGRGARYSPAQ